MLSGPEWVLLLVPVAVVAAAAAVTLLNYTIEWCFARTEGDAPRADRYGIHASGHWFDRLLWRRRNRTLGYGECPSREILNTITGRTSPNAGDTSCALSGSDVGSEETAHSLLSDWSAV
jgi:hypothetical protein